ncbi:hypothetical protein INT47_011270 [Mucor saturninus]|uniref:SWIM-type domain-containing protein n=1 Tax=Mucor saturninus TaxID=64648 RepID=A0A8H7RNU3_9FUNG|nr:hypothetical protein INT47_011270 [Mucor saturninus]
MVRQRQQTYVFREYYVCHCSGSKREHAGVVRGGTSVQVRSLQKRSKKIKCPAALKVVCLPALPIFSNGSLYTIVTRHSLTGTGCPVTFFFLIDQSMGPLANFVGFLRNNVGILNIEKITLDVSSTELGAIQEQEPGDTHHNNTLQSKSIATLKAMMWERDRPVFTRKLTVFITENSVYHAFLQYFKIWYLENDAFMRWSAAYQPAIYTNMETNNYVESWHNQLRTTYLGRETNRRVNRLVFVLVKDVLSKYGNNISRILLKVVRMCPEERRHSAREMQAEAISADALEQIIETARTDSAGRSGYVVSSFSTSDVSYDVVVDDLQMITCNCPDFCFNNIACKHMYLLKCDMSRLSVFEVSYEFREMVGKVGSPDSSALFTPDEQAPLTDPSNSSTEFDTLLSNIHKLKR